MLKKLNLLLSAALVCGCGLFAQEATENAATAGATVTATAQEEQQCAVQNDVDREMGESYAEIKEFKLKNNPQKELEKIRLKAKLGDKKKGSFSAVSQSDIATTANSKNYVTNRVVAFAWADMAARQKIAATLKQKISSAMQEARKSGSLKAADLNGNEALTSALNTAIRKEMEKKGVDLTDPEAIKKAMPEITESSSFKRSVEIEIQGFLTGVSTYATLSTDTQVGVLVYSSNTLRQIAEDIVMGTTHQYTPGGNIEEMIAEIPEEEMANTVGLRVKINEEGEPVLLAFAQWPVTGSEDIAMEAAGNEASAMIREFVGMSIIAKTGQSLSMQKVYMLDNENIKPQALAEAQAAFKKECEAVCGKVDFSGIDEVTSGVIELPSGDNLAYSVKYWTPNGAKAAAEAYAKNLQLEQVIKAKGLAGTAPKVDVAPAKKAPASSPTAKEDECSTPRKNKGAAGKGFTGDAL